MATVKSYIADLSSASSLPEQMTKGYAKNVNFETLNGGQFRLSTQLILLNYPVILSHRCNTTVSLETYPLYPFYNMRFNWKEILTNIFVAGKPETVNYVISQVLYSCGCSGPVSTLRYCLQITSLNIAPSSTLTSP